ncbi:hypothetical protein C8F04DRAFT_1063910 [Mycena alexandri]|uniref:Uncharacterized protein n=1 Tax=Mycena alexandri TaxID=1745969 RepID=A0AAD6XBI6_9AGAR|nr:hypothetical protein C8F04DRAFT_1063910 [Mycena alexandri]
MAALPQELLDTIVENIGGPTSHNTLKFCALASSVLRSTSQRRLFSYRSLTPKTVSTVAQSLSASPHLGSYIHDLHIVFHLDSLRERTSLTTILALLTGVQRLVIASFGWQSWDWKSFPADFRAAILSVLILPTMRCLALTRCRGVPLAIIRHALTSYQEVAIFAEVTDSDEDPILFPAPNHDGSLTHLLLSYLPNANSAFHALLLSDQMVSSFQQQLRHLELAVRVQNSLNGLEEIALKYSHFLEHLTVNFNQRYDDQVEVPHLPDLRALTLRASVGKLRIPRCIISTIVSLSSSTPHLTVLNIIIEARYEGPDDFIRDYDFSDTERRLEELSSLRAVNWTVRCGGVADFEERVRTVLPRANAAGILSFVVQNPDQRARPMLLFSR